MRGVFSERQGYVERRTEDGIAEKPQRWLFQVAGYVDVPQCSEHARCHQPHGYDSHPVMGS